MQNQIHCLEMGLKAPLTLFTSKEPPLSSPSSPTMTSNKNHNALPPNENQLAGANKSNHSKKKEKEKKVFPPPIPLLARTQNLAPHMPWILKRYYTSEGRLILKEEKVRHHEYFRAHRANGRLTLQLVPLDDGGGDDDHDYDDCYYDDDGECRRGDTNECLMLDGLRSSAPSPCNFGVPLHRPIRTVHG